MSTPAPELTPSPEPPPTVTPVENVERSFLILSAVTIELCLILVAMAWGWLFEGTWTSPFAKLRGDWGDALLGVGLSLPLFATFWVMDRTAWGPFRHVRRISDDILKPMLKPCKWPDVFLFSTLAGFCEELLFRGAIQSSLAEWLGPGLGIFLAGVIFGLAHWLNLTYLIAASIIGCILGIIFYWTDSLLVVMVTHGLYDVWAMLHLLYATRDELVSAPVVMPAAAEQPPPPEVDSCTN